MKHFRTAGILFTISGLPACTDYATFVTATDIGITADAHMRSAAIGYNRAELFTGPGYPEQGEAPRAVGFIKSDLQIFDPHIKQLYATGEAAELVTLERLPPTPPIQSVLTKDPNYYGQRRPLVFGTGANIGLKVSFNGAAAPIPTTFKFGYNREELSIIPLRRDEPTKEQRDRYASVLASIELNLKTVEGASGTTFGITQFFATGAAALNLAKLPRIREYFGMQATAAIQHATSLEELNQVLNNDTLKIKSYFAASGYTEFSRETLLKAPGHYDEIPLDLKTAATETDFFTALAKYPLLTSTLADSIPK
ncbi:MAG: hypothetical protein AB7H90_09365 [Alphaproteobacteria bacterium]